MSNKPPLHDIGPGHIWVPVTTHEIQQGLYFGHDSLRAIDLHAEYPTPGAEAMQSIYDNAKKVETTTDHGATVPSLILNGDSDKGTIFVHNGYGVNFFLKAAVLRTW